MPSDHSSADPSPPNIVAIDASSLAVLARRIDSISDRLGLRAAPQFESLGDLISLLPQHSFRAVEMVTFESFRRLRSGPQLSDIFSANVGRDYAVERTELLARLQGNDSGLTIIPAAQNQDPESVLLNSIHAVLTSDHYDSRKRQAIIDLQKTYPHKGQHWGELDTANYFATLAANPKHHQQTFFYMTEDRAAYDLVQGLNPDIEIKQLSAGRFYATLYGMGVLPHLGLSQVSTIEFFSHLNNFDRETGRPTHNILSFQDDPAFGKSLGGTTIGGKTFRYPAIGDAFRQTSAPIPQGPENAGRSGLLLPHYGGLKIA